MLRENILHEEILPEKCLPAKHAKNKLPENILMENMQKTCCRKMFSRKTREEHVAGKRFRAKLMKKMDKVISNSSFLLLKAPIILFRASE